MKSSRVLKRKEDRKSKLEYKKLMSGKRYNPIKETVVDTIKTIVKYINRTEERKLARQSNKDLTKKGKVN